MLLEAYTQSFHFMAFLVRLLFGATLIIKCVKFFFFSCYLPAAFCDYHFGADLMKLTP